MSRFVNSLQRAALGWYLVIAFGFTWALLPWAANSVLVSLVALCGPAVAALVVVTAMPPVERLKFRSRLKRWRLPVCWYLLALALPWPITLLRSGLEYAWGGGRVELMPIPLLGLVVFVLVAGEEIGWRGFVLPRLLPRFGAWRASVIIGIVWAFWHLPLFFVRGMPQFGTPFSAFVIYTVALSVILTYLAQQTRGSVLIATLFHGAVNTFGWVNPNADPATRGGLNALCYGLVALFLGLIAWNRRTTSSREAK